jgi:hypothetical protein
VFLTKVEGVGFNHIYFYYYCKQIFLTKPPLNRKNWYTYLQLKKFSFSLFVIGVHPERDKDLFGVPEEISDILYPAGIYRIYRKIPPLPLGRKYKPMSFGGIDRKGKEKKGNI